MKVIDLIRHKHVRFTHFPDGQPHVDLQGVIHGETVKVICRLRYPTDIMHLLQVSDALDTLMADKRELEISYLMAARYDRHMRDGDSFDLRVVAKLINSCHFGHVSIFDVHSHKSLEWVNNSTNMDNYELVMLYDRPNSVLIVPDAGAEEKSQKYLDWNHNLTERVRCDKRRDLDTGKIHLNVLSPSACVNRNCVIIDDICDGGGTFLAIANQIMSPKFLTLIVTHGIFSKGRSVLLDRFNHIITTDSYQYQNPRNFISVLRIYEPTTVNRLL